MYKKFIIVAACCSTLAMEHGPIHSYSADTTLSDRLRMRNIAIPDFLAYVRKHTPHRAIGDLYKQNGHWPYLTTDQVCHAFFFKIYAALHNQQAAPEDGPALALAIEETTQTVDGIWTATIESFEHKKQA